MVLSISSAKDAFQCFNSDAMLLDVFDVYTYTNMYAKKYFSAKRETWEDLTLAELKKIMGILILFGAYRGNHKQIRKTVAHGRDKFKAAFDTISLLYFVFSDKVSLQTVGRN